MICVLMSIGVMVERGVGLNSHKFLASVDQAGNIWKATAV